MKIKISRSLTVNTGNFSSIKPSVEVEVDVPAATAEMAAVHLQKIADSLMAIEFLTLSDEMVTINNVGWGKYRELLEGKTDLIVAQLIENADKLVELEM
jgi:hypothetical protein